MFFFIKLVLLEVFLLMSQLFRAVPSLLKNDTTSWCPTPLLITLCSYPNDLYSSLLLLLLAFFLFLLFDVFLCRGSKVTGRKQRRFEKAFTRSDHGGGRRVDSTPPRLSFWIWQKQTTHQDKSMIPAPFISFLPSPSDPPRPTLPPLSYSFIFSFLSLNIKTVQADREGVVVRVTEDKSVLLKL